jgi:hypothetical protein
LARAPKAAVLGVAVLLVVGGSVASALVWRDEAVSGKPTAARSAGSLRADFTARLRERGQSELAPAAGSRFETLTAKVNGAAWSFSSYRNSKDELCVVEVVPGEGRGYGCRVGGPDPLNASWGSRQDPDARGTTAWDEAWVEGIARRPVSRVELVLTDCTSIALPMTSEGAYFGVVGAEAMHAGVSPYLVRGLDAKGRVVASDVSEFGPASSADGIIGPAKKTQPSAACSVDAR